MQQPVATNERSGYASAKTLLLLKVSGREPFINGEFSASSNFCNTFVLKLQSSPVVGLLKKADKIKNIFSQFGINYGDVSRALESVTGAQKVIREEPSPPLNGRLVLITHADGENLSPVAVPFSRSGKLTLLIAFDLAELNGNNGVGPEHVLMAVIQQNTAAITQILSALRLNPNSLEYATREVFVPPSDDFAEAFNSARMATAELLEASIQSSRKKLDQAMKNKQQVVAQEALKELNEFKWTNILPLLGLFYMYG